MKAGPVVIGHLLQQKHRYIVPIYQRHYVWSKDRQWEPFWNDIQTKAIERLDGRERRFSHFMGAVVLESRGGYSVREVPSFQVVDGQQRLTTFQIFLAAAREYARVIGYTSAEERIKSYLLNENPHLMQNEEVEIFKVWPTQYDRDLFIDILTLGGRDALRAKYPQHFYKTQDRISNSRDTPRLIAGYGYFYDRIKHAVETDELEYETFDALGADEPDVVQAQIEGSNGSIPPELKLDAIWQALVEEFKVVEISLEEGDDAQVIFETLNERGEPLLAADLVRNNIFQRADAGGESAEKLFKTYWHRFEDKRWTKDERQGRFRQPRIEFFLANYISGKIASEVNLTKLFSEYKAFTRASQFDSVADELSEIDRFGDYYFKLVEHDEDTPLGKFAARLAPWDVTTVFPLVLRLWDSTMDEEEKTECLNALLSFIVRRAICGLTAKNYNRFFLSSIAHLNDEGWTRDSFISLLLRQQADTARFPLDDEFERRWVANPLYKMLAVQRTRAILEELELVKRTRYHEVLALADELTVEHVLPTQWITSWPLPDGTVPTNDQLNLAKFASEDDGGTVGQIVRRTRFKDTIGNLTLLTQPLNSSVSNGPFERKRQALMDHSLLVLNQEITRSEEWNEDAIAARSRDLFALAASIWPVPQIDVQPEESDT